MQRLIFLVVLICFTSVQTQKKDTIYIGVKVVKLEDSDLINSKYPMFEKTLCEEGKKVVFYEITTQEYYNFWHDIDRHQKKELSKVAFLKLNIFKGECVRDILEQAYPGFGKKALSFYFSREQSEKRRATWAKNAKDAVKNPPKKVALPEGVLAQEPIDDGIGPDPTYIPFFHFYLVETTEEGRHFLYEVDCSYEPWGIE